MTWSVSHPTLLSFAVAVHRPRPGRSGLLDLVIALAAALEAFLLGPTAIDLADDLVRHPSAPA